MQKLIIFAIYLLTPGLPNPGLSFDDDTTTAWFPGWSPAAYPARCVVDLGQPAEVRQIRVYDGSGQTTLRAYAAEDSTGQVRREVLALPLTLYQVWREQAIAPTTSRYWVFEMEGAQGDQQVPEIELWGSNSSTTALVAVKPPTQRVAAPPPATATTDRRAAATRIGTCGFHWVPLDKLQPFAAIRLYLSSAWLWRPDGLFVQPLYQAAKPPQADGLDTYLTLAKARGLTVVPAIHQSPDWYLQGVSALGADHPPVKKGLDRTDPASWRDLAGFWWQFTARYGRQTWPDERLRVDTTLRWKGDAPNRRKSGLDLLRYVEIGNEWDKWWKKGGRENDIYLGPEAHAALLSACYDAVKSADSSMLVVMAGLTGFDLPYLEKMDAWFRSHRADGRFACDVINVHHYSNRGNQPGQWPPTWHPGGAVPPELDADFATFAKIVQFARQRGKQIWCSEFGYDSQSPADGQPLSWQYPQKVAGRQAEDLQADWLVRSYLEYFRLGADMAFMFNAVDEPGWQSGGLYQSSGLLRAESSPQPFAPKPAYHAISALAAALDGYHFVADRSTAAVRILEYAPDKPGLPQRYFYWMPTADGRVGKVSIAGRPVVATESVQTLE